MLKQLRKRRSDKLNEFAKLKGPINKLNQDEEIIWEHNIHGYKTQKL